MIKKSYNLPKRQRFLSFNQTPMDNIKIVILGQDLITVKDN